MNRVINRISQGFETRKKQKIQLELSKAISFMQNKEWEQSIIILSKLISRYGNRCPSDVFAKSSICFRNQKNYTSALEITKHGLSIYPDDELLLIENVEASSVFNSEDQNIKNWESLLNSVDKRKPYVQKRLIDCHLSTDNTKQVLQLINKFMKKDSDNLDFLEQKAKIYEKTNDFKLSVDIYNSIINSNSDQKKSTYVSLVEDLLKLKDFDQAETVAEKGWRIFNDFQFKVFIAEIPTIEKKWKEALKLWSKLEKKISIQKEVEDGVRLHVEFNLSVIKRIVAVDQYVKKIKTYQTRKSPKKYVIYTSYSKGYDQLKLPEFIDNRFDYVVYTDEAVDGSGIYDVRPLPSHGKDNARKIRYAKTHPHVLFPDYEAAIWLDASFLIIGDLFPLLDKFIKSGEPLASTPHQHRTNIFDEYEACVVLKKEDPVVMKKQIEKYKSRGFNGNILAENTALMFNINHSKLDPIMETWWEEITNESRRDQLSFGYALYKNKASWHHIVNPPLNVRNFSELVLTQHNKNYQILSELNKAINNVRKSNDF